QLAQDAGGGRLADGHRAGDSDDEGGLRRTFTQERRGDPVQSGRRRDVEGQQPGQREVDLLDLLQVDGVAQAPQAGKVALVEVERVVLAQAGPRVAIELDEGGRHGRRRGGGRG